MLGFRQVNEFLDDNFDFRQVCSKTISSTLHDRSGRHSRCGEARLCEWQPPMGALSPPTDERCRQHPTVDNGSPSGCWWRRPDSQPEPELKAPANSNAPSHSDRSETHAEPEADVSTSAGTDMDIGVNDRRVRFPEERDPRRHLDVSSDRELMEEPCGKVPRRAETSESVVPFLAKQARPRYNRRAQPLQVKTDPESVFYLSMTEEGPTGE